MKWAVLLTCVLATACRDVPDNFSAPNPFDSISPGETGRLTWNIYEDHSPVWNATSDTVYYSARSYPNWPVTGGLLLSIPRSRGRADLMLSSLQRAVAPQPWLAAPALSPDKASVAFVELTEVNDPTVICNAGIACRVPALGGPDTSNANTPLVRALLRVRALDGSGTESRIPIVFAGKDVSQTQVAHPFQRQYERDRAEVFRPSWSPDGTRLVYSDGLRLYIWTIGAAAATPIPNTDDGVWPAWHPSSNVIAFTRLLRTGSHTVACDCYRIGRPTPVDSIERIIYHDGNTRTGTLMTIRADGTDLRDLGIGEAPAWTPDGQSLLFQRGSEIWRAAVDGSNAAVIPNTTFGHEPAVSPNGQFLTFSRRDPSADEITPLKPYDIWVVDF
jgi:hypothetical protein